MNRYLVTAILVEIIFFAILFVGLYAKLLLSTPVLPPDKVISTYIVEMFSPLGRSVIMLGVLAAGFSTMEGILLSLSTIFANDFYGNIVSSRVEASEAAKQRLLRVSKVFLLLLAPVTYYLSMDQIVAPSLSVALFAQNGVYGLFSATFIPILFGVFAKDAKKHIIFASSVVALLVHFGMFYGRISMYHNNPAVTASMAIIASILVAGIGTVFTKKRNLTA